MQCGQRKQFMVSKNQNAFTLLELVVMVSIVGIMLAIAVPRLKFDTLGGYKADTAARKIVTDLRRTRNLAITSAATNSDGFKLKFTGSSPYHSYEIINRNDSATVDSHTIDSGVRVTSASGSEYRFGPLGNRLSGSGTKITVSAENRTYEITVVTATGAIKCVRE